jgi:hypothetical protein
MEYQLQLIPNEIINIILSYLDGDDLMPNRTVCRIFYQMINKLIYAGVHVGEHYNIFRYLFRIPNLSLSALQFYLNDISFSDDNLHEKFAHVMLASFTNQYIAFVSEIIVLIIKNTKGRGIKIPRMKNSIFATKNNMFFKQALRGNFIDRDEYCVIWLITILSAGRMDLVYLMYPDAPVNEHLLLLQLGETYNFIRYDDLPTRKKYSGKYDRICSNYLKKMVLNYDQKYIASCIAHPLYAKIIVDLPSDVINQCMRYALYRGNLNMFNYLFKTRFPQKHFRELHKTVTICLLRCNHISEYLVYKRSCADNICQLIDLNMKVDDIENFGADDFDLPPLSLETLEFCAQNFHKKID